MEESARHLMFHAVVMLLAGLFAGIPYGKAINKNTNQRLIEAWRVAHAALPIGAILMLVISVSFAGLNVADNLKWAISVLFIVSAYGFLLALLLGPVVGHRGLSSKGPISAKLVYSGNVLGAVTSLSGTLALLYAAWLNL
jgi:hypothetical protein